MQATQQTIRQDPPAPWRGAEADCPATDKEGRGATEDRPRFRPFRPRPSSSGAPVSSSAKIIPFNVQELNNLQELGTDIIEYLAGDHEFADPALAAFAERITFHKAPSLYSEIIHTMSQLRFTEEVARRKWDAILKHKYCMSERQGRNVGIRVAMLDYFLNITREVRHVTMMEVTRLEETQRDNLFDWLTGVCSKRHFMAMAEAELERARRHGETCSFFFFDIDFFKAYNDRWGHLRGDALLRLLPQYVCDLIRPYDVMGRYGGEEFVVLFPDAGLRDAYTRAEEIRSIVADLPFAGREIFPEERLSISGGIASYPHHGETLKEILDAADKALYQAKKSGRNRVFAAAAPSAFSTTGTLPEE
ncbi:MAG: GGDEF domain-containing protein [Candidatus Hydrogenedentota bacterium]